jgi:hypothetical protein
VAILAVIRQPGRWIAPQTLALVVVLLLLGACDRERPQEVQARERAESRAGALVDALRRGDWSSTVRFVYLDTNTRARMEIATDAGVEDAAPKIEAWFRKIYGTVRPRSVRSVTIDRSNPTRALVEYWHDDLDAFRMHFVNGDWFYVLE